MYSYEKSTNEKKIQISLNTRITVVLNKCPSQWVNGIYDALGIPGKRLKKSFANMLSNITRLEGIIYGLRKESLKTLPFVHKDRSWVKYGQLRLHVCWQLEKIR